MLFREAIRTDGGLDETRKAREMGAFSVGTPTVFAGVSRNRDLDNAALSLVTKANGESRQQFDFDRVVVIHRVRAVYSVHGATSLPHVGEVPLSFAQG
jgi:hypothetical protein